MTWIRITCSAGFRSGEWAQLRGTAELPGSFGRPGRPCYLVMFPDGAADFWPVQDPWATYEFLAAALDQVPDVAAAR